VERAGAQAAYVGLGTYRNIFAALTAGDIDAGALPIDYRFQEQSQSRWNFLDTCALELPTVFATTRRAIAQDRELVLRVLCGFVEALGRFRTQAAATVPLLQEFLGFRDRHAVERLHEHYKSALSVVPRPTLHEGMPHLREILSPRYPAARTMQENDIVDSSLIDELEQRGFIAQLHEQERRGE
jgi:hypothetical protein